MSNVNTNLNLARKWRPKHFDSVVGQDIAIRMLKNSLFLNKFFPVYLFAGQRGCGKTSTARIFAAAVNCSELKTFQQNPTIQIPCLVCKSCIAMINGDHPDFIEIDAASHTGVDNVRQIIESSSYMPLVGQKKIYLIDEAHMLSKAAFNAFLKILEEPPMTVLFILATTETPKIPPTVLSRCFQLTFNPIQNQSLKAHLRSICSNEGVSIEDGALDILLDETEGSARDAINLLERVRFSSETITEETILAVLGKIGTNDLFSLVKLVIHQKPAEILSHLQSIHFEQRSPQLVWDMLVQVCRDLVWVKYGVGSATPTLRRHNAELSALAQECSLNRLIAILNFFWTQEEIFLKTSKKHLFIEMLLVQLCQQVNVADLEEIIKSCAAPSFASMSTGGQSVGPSIHPPTLLRASSDSSDFASSTQIRATTDKQGDPVPALQSNLGVETSNHTPPPLEQPNSPWQAFLLKAHELNDGFLSSILMQVSFVSFSDDTKLVTIQFNTESSFLRGKLEESKPGWLPLLQASFHGCQGIAYAPRPADMVKPAPTPQPKSLNYTVSAGMQPALQQIQRPQAQNSTKPSPARENEYLQIRDSAAWPQASLLLSHFPGRIKKIM